MSDLDSSQEGLVISKVQTGNRMTDSTYSLTDLTLEQAALRLQEIERENLALKDNLRAHNVTVKKQYEALAEWRRKEIEKFEQIKAMTTALKAENQELQVKVMTYSDREKELLQQLQGSEEEKARLQRQKALSDQRLFNVYKMAEEQGMKDLVQEELGDTLDSPDAPVFVLTTDNEEIITKLEVTLGKREDLIAKLRAEILKKEQEVHNVKETTKHLLKDMEAQQKLKASIEDENRKLTAQILQAEQKLHKQMQTVMATTRREMQAEQMLTAAAVAAGGRLGQEIPQDDEDQFSFPENMKDLVGIAKLLENKQQEESTAETCRRNLEEEKKNKQVLMERIQDLEEETEELNARLEEKTRLLEEAQQRSVETAEKLAQEYDRKLMEVARNNSSKPIQASNTVDVSTLRSQVLGLLKEVDDAQNKLSAALAALSHKDDRIMELEQLNQASRNEYVEDRQELLTLVHNLRAQTTHQQKSINEMSFIKNQHEQLQLSFSALVNDYKELEETFAAYRSQMDQQATKVIRKDVMEEINRLTASVIAADECIAQREEELERLRRQLTENSQDERISLLQFQAEIYKGDFEAERAAREKLAEEKDQVVDENAKLQQELTIVKEQNKIMAQDLEGYNRREINDMQSRFQVGQSSVDYAQIQRATPPLAQDFRYIQPDFRHSQQDLRHSQQDLWHSQQDLRHNPQDSRHNPQDSRHNPQDSRHSPQDSRHNPQDSRHNPQDFRLNMSGYYQNPPDYRPLTHDYRQASQDPRSSTSSAYQVSAGRREEEDLQSFQEYECPSCAVRFPDVDSLQLHVPECIDNR